MAFLFSKGSINSVFCDFYSEYHAIHPTEFFGAYGLKWPDDFEKTEDVGNARFQVIRDFKSALCFFNHEGNLHPYTERKLLQRKHKVKKNVVIERLGDRTPFGADNVYFLETGFNLGNVEYMTFDLSKKNQNSFDSYRKVAYRFPLFWLLNEVVALKEKEMPMASQLESIQKLENERILSHQMLKEWKFMERDVSPSADEYRERCELPLNNYYFSRNEQVHIWLKFEFFSA
jgi:hypothetical protein